MPKRIPAHGYRDVDNQIELDRPEYNQLVMYAVKAGSLSSPSHRQFLNVSGTFGLGKSYMFAQLKHEREDMRVHIADGREARPEKTENPVLTELQLFSDILRRISYQIASRDGRKDGEPIFLPFANEGEALDEFAQRCRPSLEQLRGGRSIVILDEMTWIMQDPARAFRALKAVHELMTSIEGMPCGVVLMTHAPLDRLAAVHNVEAGFAWDDLKLQPLAQTPQHIDALCQGFHDPDMARPAVERIFTWSQGRSRQMMMTLEVLQGENAEQEALQFQDVLQADSWEAFLDRPQCVEVLRAFDRQLYTWVNDYPQSCLAVLSDVLRHGQSSRAVSPADAVYLEMTGIVKPEGAGWVSYYPRLERMRQIVETAARSPEYAALTP